MHSIDINCDLGESFGAYQLGSDATLMPYISSCNIACGFHAGDPFVMSQTVALALSQRVNIGAHPSYPDLQGFGRRSMDIDVDELKAIMIYQIGALKGMVEAQGGVLKHVKPHGALYNDAAINPKLALCLAQSIQQVDEDLVFLGLADSAMSVAAKQISIPFAHEGFIDRRYAVDGTLQPRSEQGSVINTTDEVVEQALSIIIQQTVENVEGKKMILNCDSLCLHGDNPNAVSIAKQLQEALQDHDIAVEPFC